jgi:hypothetical protein
MPVAGTAPCRSGRTCAWVRSLVAERPRAVNRVGHPDLGLQDGNCSSGAAVCPGVLLRLQILLQNLFTSNFCEEIGDEGKTQINPISMGRDCTEPSRRDLKSEVHPAEPLWYWSPRSPSNHRHPGALARGRQSHHKGGAAKTARPKARCADCRRRGVMDAANWRVLEMIESLVDRGSSSELDGSLACGMSYLSCDLSWIGWERRR